MSAAVSVKDLTVQLGGRDVLGPLDLEVAGGEHLLLVGASGSGKTTLLRAIAGLERPRSGSIELFGSQVSNGTSSMVRPEKRGIGFLFQGGALWPHMNVERTLTFTLSVSGTPKPERARRVAELLEWVELKGFEKRLPATLSGGEAQRLALARALAVRPRLLLLDEPLGPLDSELRSALLTKLGELQQRLELTVLHVTHDPTEAASIATRTLRMTDGKLNPSVSSEEAS